MEERHPASERSHSLTETRRTVSSLSGNHLHIRTSSFHHFRKLRYRTGRQYAVCACVYMRDVLELYLSYRPEKISRFMKERRPASERSHSLHETRSTCHFISGNNFQTRTSSLHLFQKLLTDSRFVHVYAHTHASSRNSSHYYGYTFPF